jgi:hypothetical protein
MPLPTRPQFRPRYRAGGYPLQQSTATTQQEIWCNLCDIFLAHGQPTTMNTGTIVVVAASLILAPRGIDPELDARHLLERP